MLKVELSDWLLTVSGGVLACCLCCSCAYRPDACVGCAQQLAVHLDCLALCGGREQRLAPQQFPKDAAECPGINGRAVAVRAQQQLRGAVPQGHNPGCEAVAIWGEVPVADDGCESSTARERHVWGEMSVADGECAPAARARHRVLPSVVQGLAVHGVLRRGGLMSTLANNTEHACMEAGCRQQDAPLLLLLLLRSQLLPGS